MGLVDWLGAAMCCAIRSAVRGLLKFMCTFVFRTVDCTAYDRVAM